MTNSADIKANSNNYCNFTLFFSFLNNNNYYYIKLLLNIYDWYYNYHYYQFIVSGTFKFDGLKVLLCAT